MSIHGRELSENAKKVGGDIRSGAKELSVLALVVLIAVLREGSETVLFLYGVAISGGGGTTGAMVAGGAVGLAGGIAVGWLLFAGLLRIPVRHFFTATSVLVLLLAAGMASQAARFLIQADVLPSLASPLWDTSSIVSNGSLAGKALTGIVGYDAQPAGMQVMFFVVVALAIVAGMAWARRRHPASS
jgi:high-affinity iron transporter